MAEIAGIFAVTHAPPLIFRWDAIEAGRKSRLDAAFTELARRISAAKPDILIMIGADHWANFFLDNWPAICIGVGEEHGGPREPWLAQYPHRAMPGHAALGQHLAREAFAGAFEPSLSYQMRLDHSFCVPLWRSGLSPLPPIVPIVVNAIQQPLPTMSRCLDFGNRLAEAVASFPDPLRVVILASGGLSHSVGEPDMGRIDEPFDRGCIEHFQRGNRDDLVAFLSDDTIARAGNGAAEIRQWLVAHGAASARGFGLIHYEPVPEAATGCGFAEWSLSPGANP